MRNLNRCDFIGRVGSKDIRVTAQGKIIANLSLAIKGERKNKQGELEDHTTWINLVFYEKLSTIVEKYVNIGDKIFVSGKFRLMHWTDIHTGKEMYKNDFVIKELEMLGSPKEKKPLNERASLPTEEQKQKFYNMYNPPTQDLGSDDWDDDIPF